MIGGILNRAVRSLLIVVFTPGLQLFASIVQRQQPVSVQAFATHLAVERLADRRVPFHVADKIVKASFGNPIAPAIMQESDLVLLFDNAVRAAQPDSIQLPSFVGELNKSQVQVGGLKMFEPGIACVRCG